MRCLVVRGEDEVLRFPVPDAEARLGSDPSNDLVVPISGVSRFHARLVPDPVVLRLFDLDSKNGLLVKGKRFREIALLPGVVVQAGAAWIAVEDGATSDFDLALEFPRPVVAPGRGTRREVADTETVTADPDGRAALSLLRDLERYEEPARPRPDAPGLVDRLRSVLGARSVALLRDSPSGPEVVVAAGEEISLEALSAGAASGNEPGISFREVDGSAVAWRPPTSANGLSALVVLPRGMEFVGWKKELLEFSLEHLAEPARALGRELASTAPRRPRLVYPEGMVPGTSPAMRSLLSQIGKTVHSRIDILVLGETGTGKELIARTIHGSGPTPGGPFVAINCAAIPSELLESELFGVRGRVATGVDPQVGRILEAHGGTLLLDEIGELPLSLQPKLLRFLQEREVHSVGASRPEKVNVRVLSISNRDLQADVTAGRFRADLYYRLRGLQFHVPPLRDRKEDIAPLVSAFASRAAEEEGKVVRGISRKALDLLQAFDWPGNVRELQSEVHRAVLFCASGGSLTEAHFRTVEWAVTHKSESAVRAPEGGTPCGVEAINPELSAAAGPEDLDLRRRVCAVEREMIQAALERSGGNKSKAAEFLGVTRAGLAMKMQRLLGRNPERK